MHIGEETTDINIEDKIYEYRGDERRNSQGRNGYYNNTKGRGKLDTKDAEKRNRDKVTADRNGKAYKSTKKLGRK